MWFNNSKFKGLKINLHEDLVAGKFHVGTMRLGDMIDGWNLDIVKPDPDNRGNGKLDKSKVNSIAKDWNVDGLHVFPVEDQEDGTFKMIDGHHRRAATLKKLLELGGISQEDLNKNVQVMIAPKGSGDELYAYIGNTRGVTTRQDILHQRKGLGALIADILSEQTKVSSVQEKFYQTIARCVYAYVGRMSFDMESEYVSFAEISKDRRVVNNDAKLTLQDYDLSLTSKEKAAIAEAIDYVNETYAEFKKFQNLSLKPGKIKLSEIAESIISNAALFGFLLWDKLSGRELITDLKAKTLAMRLSEKDSSVEDTAAKLMNSRERDDAAKKMVKLLNPKNVEKFIQLSN